MTDAQSFTIKKELKDFRSCEGFLVCHLYFQKEGSETVSHDPMMLFWRETLKRIQEMNIIMGC